MLRSSHAAVCEFLIHIVTVRKKAWGIEMDKRITEIQEIYENGGFSIVPTFGDPLPDSVDLSDN